MFTNLHAHSTFSNLDGYGTPSQIMQRVKELGQNAVAITDHGNIDAHVPFQVAALKAGIKPIFGCEMYMCEDMNIKTRMTFPHSPRQTNPHITVIAHNNKGYKNLLKLYSLSYEKGFYYKPRIDEETLWKYQEGLVVLSGCLGGIASQWCISKNIEEAAGWLFGMKNNIEHFYVEMIPVPTLKESNLSISYLGILSQALEIPPVITSDAHFPRPEDYWLQSILSCVSVRKRMDDPTNTVKLESYMYYGSREELEDRFNQAILINEPNIQKDLAKIGKTGLDNTYAISEMCNVEIPTANKIYAGGLDTSPDQALYNLIHAGFVNRCNEGLIPEEKRNEYWQRAMYELSVLKAKQFCDYILIVNDIIQFAKAKESLVVCRGSAGGCLILWIIGASITDSIKYSLSFERFYNETRSDPPDVDMDFEPTFRPQIIKFLESKYGEDNVGHINNSVTYKAKQAVKDVAFVFGIDSYAITPLVDELDSKDIEVAEQFERLTGKAKVVLDTYPQLLNAAKLIGQSRQSSVHAAGIVISPKALSDTIGYIKKDGNAVTSVDKYGAAFLGFLKFDVLAVIGLEVISKACKRVGISPWSMQYLPCGDRSDIKNQVADMQPYDIIKEGKVAGIFQIDGAAYHIARQISLDSFEDFYASSALCRPGALNFVSDYAKYKKDRNLFDSEMSEFSNISKAIIEETHGVILYQEQVMRFCREMAGMEWEDVHAFRKRISSGGTKAQHLGESETDKQLREKFENGCLKNGIAPKEIKHWWEKLCAHGAYSFNKSHCVTYGIVGYWMLWLKKYYPVEFYCEFCDAIADKTDKSMLLKRLVGEASQDGIKFIPININSKSIGFAVTGEKEISGGPVNIKGIGLSTANKVVNNAPYSDWQKFATVVGKALFTKIENSGLTGRYPFDSKAVVELIPWYPILRTPDEILASLKNAKISSIGLASSCGNCNDIKTAGYCVVKQRINKAGAYRGKQNIYMLEDETGQMQCRIPQKYLEQLGVKADSEITVGKYVAIAGNIFNGVFYFNNYVILG